MTALQQMLPRFPSGDSLDGWRGHREFFSQHAALLSICQASSYFGHLVGSPFGATVALALGGSKRRVGWWREEPAKFARPLRREVTAALGFSIPSVVSVSTQEHMVGIDAARVVAFVADQKVAGVDAIVQEVGDSVREERPVGNVEAPSAIFNVTTEPVPAFIDAAFVDQHPKLDAVMIESVRERRTGREDVWGITFANQGGLLLRLLRLGASTVYQHLGAPFIVTNGGGR